MSTEIVVNNDIIEINVTEETIIIEAPSGAYPLPSGVYSVYGRTGNVVAQDGDYNLTQLGDVTIVTPSTGQVLRYNGTAWVNSTESYVGTVTSVAASVPTGLTISGSPITTSGTLAFGLDTGYVIPLQSTLDAKALKATTISTTAPLTGGGDLSANRTFAIAQSSTSVDGYLSATDFTTFNNKENAIAAGTTAQYWRGDKTWQTLNTTAVVEGTNLYYTDARARGAVSFVAGSGAYNSTTGVFTIPTNTNQLTNGASFITLLSLSATAPLSYSNTTGVFTISQATTSTNGYLSYVDWNVFNNKQSGLTFGNLTSSDITVTGGTGAVIGAGSTMTLATVNTNVGSYGTSTSVPTITVNGKGLVTAASQTAIPTASSSVTGLLTSANWSTFNGKQNALSGTGFVKISGTTISYDNSTYLTTISGITAGGELSGTYANPSLVNSAVTGKVLTGVNITGGSVTATDSILTAFGKVQNQINGLIGGSIYKGTWNASTNTPALASGVGTAGNYYIVSVAGTTNLDGITDWQVGDWAIFQGTTWQKVDNTDAVVSVNGFTGAVSLTTSNISEGTNLYYTDARARSSNSAGTGISYNSTSGVITNSAPDQTVTLTGAGTTSISGTYPSFTITSNDTYNGTVTSVGITESSAALSITGSPLTTSGNINIGFAGNSTQYVAGDGSLVTFPTIVTEAQNLICDVYNNTGATLTKGTIVYINGGHGNLPTVTKALATSDATSAQTFGMVQVDITSNNNGHVIVIGQVSDLDTSAYADGTQLYLSSTTAGAYTSTKQYAPAHLVYVGIVVYSHPTHGTIEVKIQNGYEMDELHNVSAQSPNDGDILKYVSSTSLWTKTAGTTTNIPEGTNLYYTDARARASISSTATGLTYTSGTGVLSLTSGYNIPTTTQEGTWDTAYTNRITSLTTTGSSGSATLVSNVLNVPTYTLAGLGGISLTSLSATTPLSYNNTTGAFTIAQATTSTSGYLSSADWNTFNGKQNALTNPVTGTGTTNYHTKFTGASTIGNSLIWDNGTNVGIGNTNTSYTLDVSGTGRFTSNLLLGGNLNQNINDGGLSLYKADGTTLKVALGNLNGTTTDEGYLGLYKANSQTVQIRANGVSYFNGGNVGIGTSSPRTNLSVTVGTTPTAIPSLGTASQGFAITNDSNTYGVNIGTLNTGNAFIQAMRFDSTATAYSLLLNPSGGNVGIGTSSPFAILTSAAPNAGAIGLGIIGRPSDDYALITFKKNDASSTVFEIGGNTASGFIINNYTAASTSFATNAVERMRITSGGNVNIGGTAYSQGYSGYNLALFGAAPMLKFQGSGHAWDIYQSTPQFYFAYDSVDKAYINPTTGAFVPVSDINKKKDFELSTIGLEAILSLKPTLYRMIDEEESVDKHLGFIAQEVKDFIPQAYCENVNGDKTFIGLDYQAISATLVKAIQEQNQTIQELKERLDKAGF